MAHPSSYTLYSIIDNISFFLYCRFKKGMWRKTIPKGLKMKKFIERPDGTLIHDSSYVGEDAWSDDPEPQDNVNQIIDSNVKLNAEVKKELKEDLGISGWFISFSFSGLI